MPRYEKRPVKEQYPDSPNSASDKAGGTYKGYPISRPEGHGWSDGKSNLPAEGFSGKGDINKKGFSIPTYKDGKR